MEEWRDIIGYEGYYQVSSIGRVKRLGRIINRDKMGSFYTEEKILHSHVNPKGYLRIQLTKETIQKSFMVHRLVASAFVLNPENKPIINHIDSNRINNNVVNLEWVTHSENLLHGYLFGNKKAKIKYSIICNELNIQTFGIAKMTQELIDRGYKMANSGSIWQCITGKSQFHLNLTFTSKLINNE